MTQSQVNGVSQSSNINLQTVLRQHNFVSLPSRSDGVQLAVRNYDDQGVVCCDILVYREINGKGKALHDEVTLLVQTLSNLQSQLLNDVTHLFSTIQRYSISFLGKKAHVLTTESSQPVYCQMIPILVHQSEEYLPSIRERTRAYPAQVIHYSHFDKFLTNNLPSRVPLTSPVNTSTQALRSSYRSLGLALILVPLCIGLSGIFLALEMVPFALMAILTSVLGPALLLRKGARAFTQFQLQNVIPIQSAEPPSPRIPNIEEPTDSSTPPSQTEDSPPSPSSTWTLNHVAVYLQDAIEKSMHDALAAYQTENWSVFSEHARAFLITGLRLGILKRTGKTPSDNPSQILDQIKSNEMRLALTAWFHRLAENRQNYPLTPEEAQHLMNYSVKLLRQHQALLPVWEVQIFQVIPRVTTLNISKGLDTLTSPRRSKRRRKPKSEVLPQ